MSRKKEANVHLIMESAAEERETGEPLRVKPRVSDGKKRMITIILKLNVVPRKTPNILYDRSIQN